jgi:ArsR family transcriptional regulator, arsenate/arsenite/antimonite-responsive transcriptional repressor
MDYIHEAERFQVLSSPVRLAVLALLTQHQGTLNVVGLLDALPYTIEQATLSHHLRRLLDAGFIEMERRINTAGVEHFYYVRPESLVLCMDDITELARGKVEARP